MDKNFWMKWGIAGALCLASGHAAVFGTMYPCPAALMTVLVTDKRSGWSEALICVLSLWFWRRTRLSAWAEIAALAVIWAVLNGLRNRGTAPVHRALTVALVWMSAKAAVLWKSHLLYRYPVETAIAEAALIVVFSYIFVKLFAYIKSGALPLVKPEGILVFGATVGILLKGVDCLLVDLLPGPVGRFQIMETGMFLITLWIGYTGGVKDGAVAGVTAGTMLYGTVVVSPAITTVLACGGMAAGLCGNEIKLLGALVFTAVTLFFGVSQGISELYTAVSVPLAASVLFLAIPQRMERRLKTYLAVEGQKTGYNLVTKQQILQMLEEYRRTFQYLSRAYVLQREAFPEDPHIRSGRMIMAHQFKGMADAVERMEEEVRSPSLPAVRRERRFRMKVAKAGAAWDGRVSGDSVCYGEARRGQFVVALSDGMGNGRRAAEESNLTVQTIYRLLAAGFRPELALRIMNSILLYRAGDEIYSTLDLALIDLYTGNLQLYKTGASLTLIRRGNQVEIVKIPALPMGIVGDIPVPSVDYRLKTGDQILLLSDGVAEAGRHQGIQWLTEAIVGLSSSDPQTVADLLVLRAREQTGEKEKDDMTAVVIVVQ